MRLQFPKWAFPLLLVSISLAGCGRPVSLSEATIPFTGESVMGQLQGETYRFFRYQTIEEAKADSAKVSPDGKSIAGTRIHWEGPVHFYYKLRRIVIYVGSNPKMLDSIEQVFGPQVAGDSVEPQKST